MPVHPFTVGVTVIVAVTLELPEFTAVKEGVVPDPLAANPMDGSELVQVNDPPAGELVYTGTAMVAPLHTEIVAGTVTVGVGLMVMVYELVAPVQPDNVGVTVIVEVIGVLPELMAEKAAISPEPLAGIPMVGSEFVHV